MLQIYGKGAAADCRRHVQKLNMMRAEKEQLENEEQLQSSSHPPEEYADAFTVQDIQPEEIVSLLIKRETLLCEMFVSLY